MTETGAMRPRSVIVPRPPPRHLQATESAGVASVNGSGTASERKSSTRIDGMAYTLIGHCSARRHGSGSSAVRGPAKLMHLAAPATCTPTIAYGPKTGISESDPPRSRVVESVSVHRHYFFPGQFVLPPRIWYATALLRCGPDQGCRMSLHLALRYRAEPLT